jgi:hypothetical protein
MALTASPGALFIGFFPKKKERGCKLNKLFSVLSVAFGVSALSAGSAFAAVDLTALSAVTTDINSVITIIIGIAVVITAGFLIYRVIRKAA